MELPMNTRISATLLVLTLSFSVSMATAQGGYPSQPIKLLVGFPPGGSTDILARALANEARTALNQEVVVITRAGASGAISVGEVVAAKPDGYTLGINPSSAFTLGFHFMDIRPDFLDVIDPLMMVARQRVGTVVKGDSPHKTLKEFIEFARRNPGKASIGVPGIGTSVEVFARALLHAAKVDAIVVPFKGDSGVNTALLGGQIVAGGLSAAGFAQQVQNGTLRAIASHESDRFDFAPDVPTLEEMGYGLRGKSIQFLYGPKGLPPAIAQRLINVFTQASRTPLFIDIATKNGLYDKTPLVGAELTALLLKDRASNAELVVKLGMKKEGTK
ncbi:MAG: tripartite tricarboxylate transporter substrate binding protein [Betaproteobacteria bacterium]|nr:tripartite tricarboxylate transporter substrate binding protein [Betaproteobacteria bacterium]